MSININEVNKPINADNRDPFYGRSKSEIGLGQVQNMSYDSIETSILANVKGFINEGVTYKYSSYASDSSPILANLIKLKPNSSIAKFNFSLGTWTENSEFIPREMATLELRSNRTNVSYNLYVTEPFPNNNSSESTDTRINKSTPLTSTKVIIKEFNTGGWLVSIKVIDTLIDAIWINFGECKNVDIQNPNEDIYDDSNFGRSIEFYCDRSRISTNLDIGGTDLIAKELDHDIPIKLNVVDPDDYYNNNSNLHSLTNINVGSLIGTSDLRKDDTIISIPISTDSDVCKKDQLIPLSVNRLNHQIKFRLSGSVHESQLSSWKLSQTDQSNLNSFLDTDPESINEFPLSISELSHDINVGIGRGTYFGSIPESGSVGGNGVGSYEFSNGEVNYASLKNSSNGRNDYYEYDSDSKSWMIKSRKFPISDSTASLSTKSNSFSNLNLVIHGLDHDLKIEVVNSNYRNSRGSATDLNGLLNDTRKLNSGIRNLTWEEYSGIENEKRRNSYVTGSIKLNSFEKDYYQCLDLTVHGLDHNIGLRFHRVDTDVISGPSQDKVSESDRYRPKSNGSDILGDISIDTFTSRIQNFKVQVIDGRYTDCSRGLALMSDGNYMPYDQIDNDGGYGNYLPTAPSSDEIESIFPTINGIPFTGDFRYKIKYPSNLERDGVSKEHSARNIVIPAYHKGSSLENSGSHDWEVLGNYRVISYNSNGIPVSSVINSSYLNSAGDIENGYGLAKLTTISESVTGDNPNDKIHKYLESLGDNSDVMSVKAFKLVMNESVKSTSDVDNGFNEINERIDNLESGIDKKIEDARTNALHKDSTLYGSGSHKWEVLESIRVSELSSTGKSVSKLVKERYLDDLVNKDNGYGLVRVSPTIMESVGGSVTERIKLITNSLGEDSDVVTVKSVKLISDEISQLDTDVSNSMNEVEDKIEEARLSSLHKDSSLEGSGSHKWEVLEGIRVASIDNSGNRVSKLVSERYLDSEVNKVDGYGLTRLTKIDSSIAESQGTNPIDKLDSIISSLSDDDDVITVKALKSIIKIVSERFENIEKNVSF